MGKAMTATDETHAQTQDDADNASVVFTAPRTVEIRHGPVPTPQPGEVLVRAVLSGISAGTELLVYRGEAPAEIDADATIEALSGSLAYPVHYGYSSVGYIHEVGAGVDETLLGQRVFGFQPHTRWYCARSGKLHLLPEAITDEDAIFLPNMETAVALVQDALPMIGSRVIVFGLGVVGLLTTRLLSRFPLDQLLAVDPNRDRRSCAEGWGVSAATPDQVAREVHDADDSFDVCIECSGAPEALDMAIQVCGFEGKIIVGSWYGTKRATLNLGDRFHRQRLQLISSQVSTIPAHLSSRWTKQRRLGVALKQLQTLASSSFITHTYPVDEARDAYSMLDATGSGRDVEAPLQVAITY